MPNWTTNDVLVTTKSKKHTDLFIKKMKSKESDFDFNSIVPMPKNIFRGDLGQEEKEKYGSLNWYDWSCDNWGTKWNSVDVDVERISDTMVSYSFLTAWSPPLPIYQALLERYSKLQNVKFEWTCVDEDSDGTEYDLSEEL
jgi:hypothetical protein